MAKKTGIWGYPFGVDGLEFLTDTAARLSCSTDTLYRYAEMGRIRIGRHAGNKTKGRTVVCKRSVNEYLKSIEMKVSS